MGYIGIDYGMIGRTNRNVETGIHYGVISQGSVGQAWYDESEADYGEPTCPKCGDHVGEPTLYAKENWEQYNGRGCCDYACQSCQLTFDSSDCFGEEPSGFSFEDSDYTLTDCLDSDIMIIRSPYYTRAQFCSPCVPGAGNLDNPESGGPKTYCLGHDWFESGKAPYPVYRVSDDSEVLPEV